MYTIDLAIKISDTSQSTSGKNALRSHLPRKLRQVRPAYEKQTYSFVELQMEFSDLRYVS